ncbi:MAG: universal stress protein [Candidatus Methanomethylophilaceae archaeon]|nr:universal stress protein [Candidatus Methanomethylophilaceae archaeon]
MNFQNILIPTDGSESIKFAVEKGLNLAKISGGKVTALYVLDQSVYSNMPMDTAVVNIYETLEKEGEEATDYVDKEGAKMGITVEKKVLEGAPSKTILNISEKYDIIVMGTLGKKGMTKVLMGSVAEKIIENATCPVMIVRANE